MGISTDGIICFGILFEEGHTFPWQESLDDLGEEVYDDYADPEEWYAKQKGWDKNVHQWSWQWVKENPLPFKLVNYCSGDCPMWILAVPETVNECSRGYPEALNPRAFTVEDYRINELLNFCAAYNITVPDIPKWYLCSYWG